MTATGTAVGAAAVVVGGTGATVELVVEGGGDAGAR
ncbi:MAG: hypothetical protein QOG87_2331, partial [Actinomycetota bacterium]